LLGVDPAPVNGIYRRPGKWHLLKYWAFYALMRLRQRKARANRDATDAGYGVCSRGSIEAMDAAQKLPKEHPLVCLETNLLRD